MNRADVTASGSNAAGSSNIRVFVRLRPPREGDGSSLALSVENSCVVAAKAGSDAASQQRWTFDQVFDASASQQDVFEACGEPLAEEVIKGFNCTVFAYGQTGSGKSHTIFGPEGSEDSDTNKGLLPRLLERLFSAFRTQEGNTTFLCKGSMVELYNEQIYDLLDPTHGSEQTLQLRESMRTGVYVENQTEVIFESAEDALSSIQRGAEGRRVAETAMNRESSRSHTVFTLILESKTTDEDNVVATRTARLNVVDLAGSERQKLTQATGDRQKEANYINRSLLCLGTVISTLSGLSEAERTSSFRPHIKYRDSKLTFLLRDSLGGNSKTYMIANINPLARFFGESLSTLKFAQRAKMIRNSAKINEDLYAADVSALKAQIKRLERQLADSATPGQMREGMSNSVLAESSESKERVEQLLSHSLAMNEAARKRADHLKQLLDSKTEEAAKLQKALTVQTGLFKMKQALASHLMKKHPAPEVVEKWMSSEKEQNESLRQQNVEAIEWRTKYQEIVTTTQIDTERLQATEELEKMNRRLSDETRQLLESKRELQDLVLALRQNEELPAPRNATTGQSEEPAFQNSSLPPRTPDMKRRSSRSSLHSRQSSTPLRVPFSPGLATQDDATLCPTPSKKDYNLTELKHLCKRQQKRIQQLEEQSNHSEEDLNKKLSALQVCLETTSTERDAVYSKLVDAQKKIAVLRRAEEATGKTATMLSARLQELQSELSDNAALREEIENVRAQAELTQRRLEENEKAHQGAIEALKQENESLYIAQTERNQQEVEQDLENQALQEAVQSLEEMRAAQKQTDELRLANLRTSLTDAQTRAQQATAKAQEAEEALQKQSERTAALESALAEYRATLQSERAIVKDLRAATEESQYEAQELQDALDMKEIELQTIRATFEQAKAELVGLHEKQEFLEKELSQTQTELAERPTSLPTPPPQEDEHDIEQLKAELFTEKALRNEAEEEMVEARERIAELESANSKLAGNANHMQKIKYVERLQEKLKALEKEVTILRRQQTEEQLATQHRVAHAG